MFEGRKITLIAAMADNRAIGQDGDMPWHLPRELQHFKAATMGHTIVMGRKTHESIGRPLPGRQNVVISRQPGYSAEGCDCAESLEQAIRIAQSEEVMIIGGGQIYAAAMPLADRMILTLVECTPEADTWFPTWSESDWQITGERQELADAKNPHNYRVLDLVRNQPD